MGRSVTEAIETLRALHADGYDLAPLLEVAQQFDPELRATCGDADAAATRYRNKLAEESGAPTLDEFRAAWPATYTYHPERAAFAWGNLLPGDRKTAIAGIAEYIDTRKRIGFTKTTSAAGYLTWIGR